MAGAGGVVLGSHHHHVAEFLCHLVKGANPFGGDAVIVGYQNERFHLAKVDLSAPRK